MGQQKIFSFLIFSPKKTKKFQKFVNESMMTLEQVQQLQTRSNKGKGIFFKYLNQVTARFTLVCLEYNPNQLKQIQLEDDKFTNSKSMKKENVQFLKSVKAMVSNQMEVHQEYRKVVFMEMRTSNKILNLDYEQLLKHPKIMECERFIFEWKKKALELENSVNINLRH